MTLLKYGLAAGFLAAVGSVLLAQAPATDIYLAPLTWAGPKVTVGKALNVTNNPGYDNQPQFLADASGLPVISDADTGYGNALNVMRTVREFEQAGLNALIFEDQEVPKRCPAAAAVIEILPVMESAAKIRAAVRARQDPNLIIVARTDALTEADAIERAKIYVEAGADLIQPISRCFTSIDGLRRLRQACGGFVPKRIAYKVCHIAPKTIDVVFGNPVAHSLYHCAA